MNVKDYYVSENCKEEIAKLNAERARLVMHYMFIRHMHNCNVETKKASERHVSEHRFLKFIKRLLSRKDKYQSNTVKQLKYQKKYKEY